MTLGKALFSIKIIRILSKIWITWAQTKTQYQQNKTIPFSIQQTLALNQWQKDYKYIPYLSKKFGNDLYHVVSHFVFFHFNFSRKNCPLFSPPLFWIIIGNGAGYETVTVTVNFNGISISYLHISIQIMYSFVVVITNFVLGLIILFLNFILDFIALFRQRKLKLDPSKLIIVVTGKPNI